MDYENIKKEYETTKTSFRKLSEKHGIHYKTLERRAKKEGWKKFSPQKIKKPPKTSSLPIIKPNIITDSQRVTGDIKELLKAYHQPIDEVLILTYIDSYQSFLELQEDVKKEGKFIDSTKGNKYMNPKYSALQMEKMNLIKIGKELGITLSARLRLQLKLEEEDSKEPSIFDIIKDIMEEDISV